MAEILKKQYDLLVLKVCLNTSGSETQVDCEIEGKVEGNVRRLDGREFAPRAMGLPERLECRKALRQGYDFRIPEPVVEWLKESLQQHNPTNGPLWLHLVKPYGYLGMVPWERLLQPVLGVPMLRLPDFLATPPRETPSVLDVVLCGSLPQDEMAFLIGQHLHQITEKILSASLRSTTLHVFTDQMWYPDLKMRLDEQGLLGSAVSLYDPADAAAYATPKATSALTEPPGRIENPWLLWIRNSLRGRSVDIAHFLCHGYLSLDRGALVFSESPIHNQDRSTSRFVGAGELCTFLTQIGAWSAAFSSPEQNYSEMGLRQLADTIAQIRPGPVVHHDIPLDPNLLAIAEAYHFLFGPPSESLPATPALFLYCHPSHVVSAFTRDVARDIGERRYNYSIGGTGEMAPPFPEEAPTNPLISEIYKAEENVPSWIAAAERYVEQQNLEIRKMSRLPSGGRQKEVEGLRETLKDIQDIIARGASTTKRGDRK